jgi:hypothetical protein
MELRKAYLGMIKSFSGGWDAMCGALAMSRQALENRIYERKGQGVDVELAMQMQAFSGTTLFAEAIASASGGTFVKLPEICSIDNDGLLMKFNALHTKIGLLSQKFAEYTDDDEVDQHERASLNAIGDEIHKATQELLALTFRIYCRPAVPASK